MTATNDSSGVPVLAYQPAKGSRHAVARTLHGFIRRVRRTYRWLFVRRLAIEPMPPREPERQPDGSLQIFGWEHRGSKMMFEWQKMPKGYRWF